MRTPRSPRRKRKKNPERSATMEGALGYLQTRIGGLAGLIPADRNEWIAQGFRFVKGELANISRYVADQKEQGVREMAARLSMPDRINLQKEINYWRALGGFLDASNIEIPDDAPQPEEPIDSDVIDADGWDDDRR